MSSFDADGDKLIFCTWVHEFKYLYRLHLCHLARVLRVYREGVTCDERSPSIACVRCLSQHLEKQYPSPIQYIVNASVH